MSKQYRNTPQKTTDMKFEKLEEPTDMMDTIVSNPLIGSITPSEISVATVTIPEEGMSRIRRIEFADGREEFHVESFRDEQWIQLSKKENFKGAQEQVDKIRNNRIVVNEILPY